MDNPSFTEIICADEASLAESAKHYGDSWKKRGGVGAFMMMARKWDRIELALGKYGNFKLAIAADKRAEGIKDDIRDLRRYLMLVLKEIGYEIRGLGAPLHRVYLWASIEKIAAEVRWDVFEFKLLSDATHELYTLYSVLAEVEVELFPQAAEVAKGEAEAEINTEAANDRPITEYGIGPRGPVLPKDSFGNAHTWRYAGSVSNVSEGAGEFPDSVPFKEEPALHPESFDTIEIRGDEIQVKHIMSGPLGKPIPKLDNAPCELRGSGDFQNAFQHMVTDIGTLNVKSLHLGCRATPPTWEELLSVNEYMVDVVAQMGRLLGYREKYR